MPPHAQILETLKNELGYVLTVGGLMAAALVWSPRVWLMPLCLEVQTRRKLPLPSGGC